jgi:hypothetical protein
MIHQAVSTVLAFLLLTSSPAFHTRPSVPCAGINAKQLGITGSAKSVRTEYQYFTIQGDKPAELARFPVDLATFDARGSLTEDSFFTDDGSLNYSWRYAYNRDGCLVMQSKIKNGVTEYTKEYSYIENANRLETKIVNRDGSSSSKETLIYDQYGLEAERDENDKNGIVTYRTLKKRDPQGNLIEEQTLFTAGKAATTTRKQVFDYGPHGLVAHERIYQLGRADPDFDFEYSYDFDTLGSWVKRTQSKLTKSNGKSQRVVDIVTYRHITY